MVRKAVRAHHLTNADTCQPYVLLALYVCTGMLTQTVIVIVFVLMLRQHVLLSHVPARCERPNERCFNSGVQLDALTKSHQTPILPSSALNH